MQRQQQNRSNPLRSVMGIVFLLLAIAVIYYVVTGILKILSFLTPVLFIATLIIDHQVVVNYGKWIGGLLKNKLAYGIGAIILSVLGAPVLALYLFGKAMLKRQVRKMQSTVKEQQRGKTTEYEEVVEEEDIEFDLKDEEEIIPLEIPKSNRRIKQQDRNSYDDLFDDL